MLVQKILFGKMPFEKKTRLRLWVGAVLTVVGIVVFAMFIDGSGQAFGGLKADGEFMSGFYLGMGGGLAAAGAVTVIKQIMMLKSETRLREAELKENDERNIFITARAAQLTLFVLLLALYIAIIVFGFINSIVPMVLIWVLGAMGLAYLVIYLICGKIY